MSWEMLTGTGGPAGLVFLAQDQLGGGSDILARLLDPGVLVFLVAGAIALAAIAGKSFTSHAKTVADRELKEQMLERGMSAEEIERVLLAGKGFSTKDAVERLDRIAGTDAKSSPS